MIEVDDLGYRYPGAPAPALRNVSFRIGRGEIMGCLGPSGAGKSTLQNVMIGLLQPGEGGVRYEGKSLQRLGKDFFNRIGVSFEHPNLYPRLTGLENLHYHAGLYAREPRPLEALLEAVGLGDAIHRRAEVYSKGMKQRLVFARAIAHRPDILYLDEPTAGLDPGLAERIKEMIRAERDRGATVFLTTHDMHVADEICDRVAFINEGRLVALDTPRNLKLAHGQRSVGVEYRQGNATRAEVLSLEDRGERERLGRLISEAVVETLHSREATLGQVFLKLTGRGLTG